MEGQRRGYYQLMTQEHLEVNNNDDDDKINVINGNDSFYGCMLSMRVGCFLIFKLNLFPPQSFDIDPVSSSSAYRRGK